MSAANPTPENVTDPTTVAEIEELLAELDAADRESGELAYALSVRTSKFEDTVIHLTASAVAAAATSAAEALNSARPDRCVKNGEVEYCGVRLAIHRFGVGELLAVDLYGDLDPDEYLGNDDDDA